MSFPVFRIGSRKVQKKLEQQNDVEPTDKEGKPTPKI
jgi:hypothetical protein